MTTQRELGDLFHRGATNGKASNVEIQTPDGGNTTRLVGYGWAVYAIRFKDTGKVVSFGWRGYSMSTSCQLTKLGAEQSDEQIDARPTIRASTGYPHISEFEKRELATL